MIEIEVWNFVLYLPLVIFEELLLESRRGSKFDLWEIGIDVIELSFLH